MNSIVLISAVWESNAFFFHILFYYGLSQDIEYSSLCYTLLFIYSLCNSLHLLIPNSESFTPSYPHSLGNYKSFLYVCKSVLYIC